MSDKPYKAWSKGIHSDGSSPSRGTAWAFSRRAWLKVFDDRLEHGNTILYANEINDAVLYEARQLFFIPVYILSVTTKNGNYQFGLNPWTKASRHFPFAFRRERIRLGHSWYSLAARAFLIGWVLFRVYRWLNAEN